MSTDNRTVVCPGSYDPVTFGHIDIITRAAAVFDTVIVGVVGQPVRKKKTLFSTEERSAFIEAEVEKLGNVQVKSFDNLVVDFARENCSKGHPQGSASDLGLRVRVRDEPAQPKDGARHRKHLHDVGSPNSAS